MIIYIFHQKNYKLIMKLYFLLCIFVCCVHAKIPPAIFYNATESIGYPAYVTVKNENSQGISYQNDGLRYCKLVRLEEPPSPLPKWAPQSWAYCDGNNVYWQLFVSNHNNPDEKSYEVMKCINKVVLDAVCINYTPYYVVMIFFVVFVVIVVIMFVVLMHCKKERDGEEDEIFDL